LADLLQEATGRLKALLGDWTSYTLGSFLLYVVGYLTLRFHLTAMGVGTDLAVIDERYLFTGARFLVYLVASVPIIVLVALPVVLVLWISSRFLSETTRSSLYSRLLRPGQLAIFGIVFAVIMIQFVMRQCFLFSNLLLAPGLPSEPAWLVRLLIDDQLMPLYFSALVAGCAIPLAILLTLRAPRGQGVSPFLKSLLAFLAAVQILLLPINYGVLIVDKTLPRVTSLGEKELAAGAQAWLVWEGQEGATFLVRNQERRRTLLTIPRADAMKKVEIVGFDRILPTLFGFDHGGQE
jgi:hypothetical protein